MASPTIFVTYKSGESYRVASMIGFDIRNHALILDHIEATENVENAAIFKEYYIKNAHDIITNLFYMRTGILENSDVIFDRETLNSGNFKFVYPISTPLSFEVEYNSLDINLSLADSIWIRILGGKMVYSSTDSSIPTTLIKSQLITIPNTLAKFKINLGSKEFTISLFTHLRLVKTVLYSTNSTLTRFSDVLPSESYVDFPPALFSKQPTNV